MNRMTCIIELPPKICKGSPVSGQVEFACTLRMLGWSGLVSHDYTASSNCSNPWLDIPEISNSLAASRLTKLNKYEGQPQNLPADPTHHSKEPLLSLSLGLTPLILSNQFEALRTTTTEFKSIQHPAITPPPTTIPHFLPTLATLLNQVTSTAQDRTRTQKRS